MLREETKASICADAALIFEATTEEHISLDELVKTTAFQRIRRKVLAECPTLSNKEIYDLLLREYSNRLRKT